MDSVRVEPEDQSEMLVVLRDYADEKRRCEAAFAIGSLDRLERFAEGVTFNYHFGGEV